MVANTYLEDAARELLEREIADSSCAATVAANEAFVFPNSSKPLGNDAHLCRESGLFWILPELVSMVEELRDRPVECLAPDIRRRILEQNFMNEHGDSMPESSMQAQVDAGVAQLLHVLERVRQIAVAHGLWSDAPVTPIMFG